MGYISATKRKSILDIKKKKLKHDKISMLTCYDYTMAKLIDGAQIDILLVGDSASNVFSGNTDTLPISLDEIIYHAKAVVKGSSQALVVVDMPFGSYQVSEEKTIEAAIRIMKETGANAIKLEGGAEYASVIKKLVGIGIPVMGHLGLTPQSVHQMGGYQVQAKEDATANELINDAIALEAAGCFSLVVEKIPADLAGKLTDQLGIPTLGIGAGVQCDGQVLVVNDMLGMNQAIKLKFAREYVNLSTAIDLAVKQYIQDVQAGTFPGVHESY